MTSVQYNGQTIDLSLARTVPERFEIPSRYIAFTEVTGPFTVRFGSPTAPPTLVDAPRSFTSCDDATIGPMFVTNEAGSGSVQWIYSDGFRVSFSAPVASGAAEPRVRALVVPSQDPGDMTGVNLITGGPLSVQNNGTDIVKSTSSRYGWRGLCSATAANNQIAKLRLDGAYNGGRPIMVPVVSVVRGEMSGRPGNYWWETETRMYWDANAVNESCFRFGFGTVDVAGDPGLSNSMDGGVMFGAGVMSGGSNPGAHGGFAASNDELWGLITTQAGTGGGNRTIDVATRLLASGFTASWHTLKLRLGSVGGVPTVEWYVDGIKVGSHAGAVSTFDINNSGLPQADCPLVWSSRAGAASTFDLRVGQGGAWTYSEYQE